jgi:hypothetical protein
MPGCKPVSAWVSGLIRRRFGGERTITKTNNIGMKRKSFLLAAVAILTEFGCKTKKTQVSDMQTKV